MNRLGTNAWLAAVLFVALTAAGCSFGPKALELSHVRYNHAVIRVAEEELLHTQYELGASAEARPFFSRGRQPALTAGGVKQVASPGPAPGSSPLAAVLQEASADDGGKSESAPPEPREPENGERRKRTVELRGRIHADAVFANQSERNKAIIGNLDNAVGFRRARIGAQGWAGEQVRWVTEFDFAGGSIAFKNVFVAVDELPYVGQVRVGHFPEPFSLEGEISSNALTLIERSPINALDPDRNWGVAVYTYSANERAMLAFGAFRSGSDASGNDIGDGNDMAYTVRTTGLPWYEAASGGRYLMHIGAAFSQRFPKNDVVTFSQGPQNSLLQFATDDPLTPFVPDISIPATQNQLYNVQWATVMGPVSFQAEWYATTIDQLGGGAVFLHGSYAYASWFLTGENRTYNRKEGAFESTRVNSPFRLKKGCGQCTGTGAWELAVRFAYLNFSDANIPLTVDGLKQGDRLAETTAGVNWYLNDNARLMFNYVHAIPVDPNFGPSAADGFFARTEVFW